MLSTTVRVKLLCQEKDSAGYITYVFDILDSDICSNLKCRYIMCTRWPNWDHRELKNGEEGFLSFTEIIAGKDTWFDGSTFIPYRYSNIQFNRFINKQPDQKHEFKL